MYDPKKTLVKFAKTFLAVCAAAVVPALASPEVQDVIKDSPLLVASIPLITAALAAGANAVKHWSDD